MIQCHSEVTFIFPSLKNKRLHYHSCMDVRQFLLNLFKSGTYIVLGRKLGGPDRVPERSPDESRKGLRKGSRKGSKRGLTWEGGN